MASISGQNTSDIDQVDGFFTSQTGGGGLPIVPLATGVNMSGGKVPFARPDMNYQYLNFKITTDDVVELTARNNPSYLPQIWAIKSDGSLWYYFLTDQYSGSGFTPVIGAWTRFGSSTGWQKLASGNDWSLAIKDGNLYSSGFSFDYAHGSPASLTAPTWTIVNNSETWIDISCGQSHSLALTASGKVFSAGNNRDYRTIQNTQSGDTTSFTQEHTLGTNWTGIAAAGNRSFLIDGGNVYLSGQNSPSMSNFTSSTSDINGPTLGYSGGDIASISANYFNATAITTGGSLRFAGFGNSNGRLDGLSTSNSYSNAWNAMTGIGADTDWTRLFTQHVNSANYETAGVKGGVLYSTGFNVLNFLRIGSSGGLPNNGTPRAINVGNTFNGAFCFMQENMAVTSFS